jgi:hypothetical protein
MHFQCIIYTISSFQKYSPFEYLFFEEFTVMGFNDTFNIISDIMRRSVLLVEESGVPGENHRPATSH